MGVYKSSADLSHKSTTKMAYNLVPIFVLFASLDIE